MNCYGLGDELTQGVWPQGVAFGADQQEFLAAIGGNENRRDAPAQTARRAVAMDFALAGIHDSQIALTVHDFACNGHGPEIPSGLLSTGNNSRGGFYRAGHYFDHSSAIAVNQLPLQMHRLAIERSHEVIGSMF